MSESYVIFVVPQARPPCMAQLVPFLRSPSCLQLIDCNMSGTYGEPDWATVTSGKADATADAGPTTTSAAAAAASTPSPS